MRRIILATSILLSVALPARAIEPWADPNLKVNAGLQVWLDAGRQNAARRALNLPEVAPGQTLDVCYDASGQRRHVEQKTPGARPSLVTNDGYTALRFDGEQQHLTRGGLNSSFKAITIFLVTTPRDNAGDFRGFLAINQAGRNDYVSGLNIDQGPTGSTRLQVVNIEGPGFGGAMNLLREPHPFATMQRFAVTSSVGAGGTKLYVNGKLAGQRDRGESMLRMDHLTIGARFYTNGGPAQVRGFLDGDILEVLIYDRVLTEAERTSVDQYLANRHGTLKQVAMPARPGAGKRLVSLPDPPPVQVLVPGFTAYELPVDLTNINNVLYRPDGKLVALAYDGNIYLLSDSDGDGLEDRVERFWDNQGRMHSPIGMALTPPGYKHGDGVFVACKGKCSLILADKTGNRAEREMIVAEGWQELPHGVDALGVAVDSRDGSVYFGLGTTDYTNAYQVGKDGKARYRLDGERGTILRIAPDLKSRAIVATGIRFPVGLRFNAAGDLFCTDQEGATWLPNGNPLDELLHIEKGRHYGFPPRHPAHLPNVIDEPSVFDYAPQHQSTCGLAFNEPVHGGPVFGPAWWRSNVFVTGYSRGKLYRTALVKSPAGYVAQTQLLAALNMLAVDACVSPRGDLVIAVHSGGPDWGSGPSGKGKLYKLVYTGKSVPQPVVAWPQSPRELRIAFDRPLDAEHVRALAGKVTIEYGAYVAAGDRFELHRPGYQVVQDQLRMPRHELKIHGLQITSDRRTLIVATAPHHEAVSYSVTLPGLGRGAVAKGSTRDTRQVPESDLRYDLTGVEAEWHANDSETSWSGWLPHLELGISRQLTAESALHGELWRRLQVPGTLTLRTKLNLRHMLRPAVQPGARIDYDWPTERVTVRFQSRVKLTVTVDGRPVHTQASPGGGTACVVEMAPDVDRLIPFAVTLPTGDAGVSLTVSYHTNEDARPRPFALHRMLLPWSVEPKGGTPVATEREIPELKGGRWARGRRVFFSDEAGCFRCHTVGGQGGVLGPDLSNLPERDYQSVLRDIAQPSFTIHPDYITHVIELKDGRILTGTLRTEGDRLHVGDTRGTVTTIQRDAIETMAPSRVSIMPEGLPKQLGPERMRDLLTFLLSDPPLMPEYGKGPVPPPRSLAEVKAVLAGSPDPPAKARPIHVALVAGKKDHGPGEHDYPAWLKVWQRLLGMADDIKVTAAMEWPSAEDLKTADVLVFYQHGQWTRERAQDIDAFLARGGGLVYVHWAVDGGADAPGFAQRIGLSWGAGAKFRHGPLDLAFETGTRHPIARNFDKVHIHDESYWNLTGDPQRVKLIASAVEEGRPRPLFWTLEPAKGRVFVSILGHFAWTFDDPLFRVLLLRGIAWTAREPVDRFNALVTSGARIRP
jgi:putative heme-binding domain-containing protein